MNSEIWKLFKELDAVKPRAGNEDHATIYQLAFGALHALARADDLGYRGEYIATDPAEIKDEQKRRGEELSQEIDGLLKQILAAGTLPAQGEWLAGFYANNAFFRIDICCEHLTRYVSGNNEDNEIEKLIALCPPELQGMLTPWRNVHH